MGESRTPVETRRFRVAGLTDADGALRAEHALLSVPGVHRAIVDFPHEQAIVRVAEYVTDEALAEAVDGAGYTLVLGSAPTAASLDGTADPPPQAPPTPPMPPKAPSPAAGDRAPPSRPLWRRMAILAGSALAFGILFSLGLVLIYRFLPVPTTMLMMSEGLVEGRAIDRHWVPLSGISPNLIRSVIASEDGEFCRHWGFDFKGMEEAWKDAQRGGRLRGASTISQQTAKNVFLWSGRSWLRKGLEAWFTLLIEALWPKQRIMEVYLNVIEWGPGVFGAEAAAQKWFGKPAARLSRLEAARLAAILPSPKRYRADPPGPYVRQRGFTIAARAGNVDLNGADRCARP
jgi:monofunctional biosynthetic peptidoglycan transglycosylase